MKKFIHMFLQSIMKDIIHKLPYIYFNGFLNYFF